MNIVSALYSDTQENKTEWYKNIINLAKYFSHSLFSEKLKQNKIKKKESESQNVISEYLNFLKLDEKEEKNKNEEYKEPIIFKIKDNRYTEVDITEDNLKNKKIE